LLMTFESNEVEKKKGNPGLAFVEILPREGEKKRKPPRIRFFSPGTDELAQAVAVTKGGGGHGKDDGWVWPE